MHGSPRPGPELNVVMSVRSSVLLPEHPTVMALGATEHVRLARMRDIAANAEE